MLPCGLPEGQTLVPVIACRRTTSELRRSGWTANSPRASEPSSQVLNLWRKLHVMRRSKAWKPFVRRCIDYAMLVNLRPCAGRRSALLQPCRVHLASGCRYRPTSPGLPPKLTRRAIQPVLPHAHAIRGLTPTARSLRTTGRWPPSTPFGTTSYGLTMRSVEARPAPS